VERIPFWCENNEHAIASLWDEHLQLVVWNLGGLQSFSWWHFIILNVFFFLNYEIPNLILCPWDWICSWADADTWFEGQQQKEEMQRMQAENRAAMQPAENLHLKKMAEEREGEKEWSSWSNARAEAEVLKQNNSLFIGCWFLKRKIY
jgi:hypothetical protein